MLRIYDIPIKEKILKRYKEVFSNDTTLAFDLNDIGLNEIFLSLTRYYDGRFLEVHRDTSSELTSVIVLTDDFEDGRFVLSEDKVKIENNTLDENSLYTINQGNGLTFNGLNLNGAQDVTFDKEGSMYISDHSNHRVVKMNKTRTNLKKTYKLYKKKTVISKK
jgi:hypothetical protein